MGGIAAPIATTPLSSHRMKVGHGFTPREHGPSEAPVADVKTEDTNVDVEGTSSDIADEGIRAVPETEYEDQGSPKRQRAAVSEKERMALKEKEKESWRQVFGGSSKVKIRSKGGSGESSASGENVFPRKKGPDGVSMRQKLDQKLPNEPFSSKRPRMAGGGCSETSKENLMKKVFRHSVEPREIIFLDDDDDDDDDDAVPIPGKMADKGESGNKTPSWLLRREEAKNLSEGSVSENDDDVQILDSKEVNRSLNPPTPQREVTNAAEPKEESIGGDDGPEDMSDVEISEAIVQEDIRKKWEEAAARRKRKHVCGLSGKNVPSNGGGNFGANERGKMTATAVNKDQDEDVGSVSQATCSPHLKHPDVDRGAENGHRSPGCFHGGESPQTNEAHEASRVSASSSPPGVTSNRFTSGLTPRQKDNEKASKTSSVSPPGMGPNSTAGDDSCKSPKVSNMSVKDRVISEMPHDRAGLTNGVHAEAPTPPTASAEEVCPSSDERKGDESRSSNGDVGGNSKAGHGAEQKGKGLETSEVQCQDELKGTRERMKESHEFQRADEEEWRRRHEELQRQALETRKLRERKRAEENKKLEIEAKQRQRVEDVRTQLQLNENTMGLKEQERGRILPRLECLARSCHDMASLLRKLDVTIEGGNNPTSAQVQAAIKRANLKFHPDRVAKYAKGDVRRLVEAEEAFKIINALKATLPLISGVSGYHPQGLFR